MLKTPPTLMNRHPVRYELARKKWPLHPRALVEGDSWFRYNQQFPVSLFTRTANLFSAVQGLGQFVSLSSATNGDTVARMLSDDALDKLGARLAKYRPKFLFFSGGGNDIVQNLSTMVWEYKPGSSVQDCVKRLSAESYLAIIRERYDALVRMRDAVSPATRIITHNYGVPNLHRGGFKLWGMTVAGPWIEPRFHELGYRDPVLMTDIMRDIMARFSRTLQSLWPAVELADTASLIQPHHWADEMHLTPAGYAQAALAFRVLL